MFAGLGCAQPVLPDEPAEPSVDVREGETGEDVAVAFPHSGGALSDTYRLTVSDTCGERATSARFYRAK